MAKHHAASQGTDQGGGGGGAGGDPCHVSNLTWPASRRRRGGALTLGTGVGSGLGPAPRRLAAFPASRRQACHARTHAVLHACMHARTRAGLLRRRGVPARLPALGVVTRVVPGAAAAAAGDAVGELECVCVRAGLFLLSVNALLLCGSLSTHGVPTGRAASMHVPVRVRECLAHIHTSPAHQCHADKPCLRTSSRKACRHAPALLANS
eukprot:scaffold4277_cov405-Prasinococcus_capsulatus_cf.AAC.11